MRVIAGTARSLPLKSPKNYNTRPTADRIKETLFNIIQNEVPGAVFLDLFSGSGGIGIEALSRGAKKCYFVEQDKEASDCILDNLKFTKFTESGLLLKQDVFQAIYHIFEKKADIIFMDPPYRSGLEKKVLDALKDMKYVTNNTLIIVETDKDTDFSYAGDAGYEIVKTKVYKTNKHTFLKRKN